MGIRIEFERWTPASVLVAGRRIEFKDYKVSTLGNIRYKGKNVQFQINPQGYFTFLVGYKEYFVHRVVMSSFDKTAGYNRETVDHLNRNKRDNRRSNLEWVSHEVNFERSLEGRSKTLSPDTLMQSIERMTAAGITLEEIRKHLQRFEDTHAHRATILGSGATPSEEMSDKVASFKTVLGSGAATEMSFVNIDEVALVLQFAAAQPLSKEYFRDKILKVITTKKTYMSFVWVQEGKNIKAIRR